MARLAPAGAVLELLRAESRLWLYLLAPRRAAAHFEGDVHVGVWRQGGNASSQQGFLILMAAEIPVVHGLVHLLWSPQAAWVLTVASLYGCLFLLADWRATRLRPVSVSARTLHLRHGLLTDLRIPRAAILAVEPLQGPVPRRQRGVLRMAGMGRANLRLRLRPDTRLMTLAGEREVHTVYLGVDRPQRLGGVETQ